ncbi:MAG: class I SAM-dependent methyltransferase [Cyclobacteriaceae bacterium]
MVLDIYGEAVKDFYQNQFIAPLLLNNSYGEPEEMPIEVFFREEVDLSTIDHLALIECSGKILDVGAGTGVHSLILQERGFHVVALENSPRCVEVMTQSGIEKVINIDFRKHYEKYDTLLVLMNGLGLAGKLKNLTTTLQHFKSLLTKGGQILIDSSDISYLYEGAEFPSTHYFGEVSYQYEYKKKKGTWFDWLYVDQDTLSKHAKQAGLKLEILMTEENDQYLAHLS